MSATILMFAPRVRDAASPAVSQIVGFPRPPGGAEITRLLNAVLQSALELRYGRSDDTSFIDCIQDFSCAVGDPAWDDGDAAEILGQLGVAMRWLETALEDRPELSLAGHHLLSAICFLKERSKGIPLFNPSAGARGLMDLGEIE